MGISDDDRRNRRIPGGVSFTLPAHAHPIDDLDDAPLSAEDEARIDAMADAIQTRLAALPVDVDRETARRNVEDLAMSMTGPGRN
jgi:hypothetical protein